MYETDHISLLCDSTVSNVFNFFLCALLQSKRNRSYWKVINSEKKKKYLYVNSAQLLF